MIKSNEIFIYSFKNQTTETLIDIPNNISIDEIVHKIITKYKLPMYTEKGKQFFENITS